MNTSSIIIAVTYIFVVFLFIIEPWFSRKNVLFGVVFGDNEVWSSDNAKQIRRRYLLESISVAVIITMIISIYYFNSTTEEARVKAFLIGIFAVLIAETIVFVIANRRTRAFKAENLNNGNLVQNKIVIETGVPEREAVISAAYILLLLPLLITTIVVAFWGYGSMPDIIATHYSFTAADAWSQKSWGIVLNPVFVEIVIAAIIAASFLLTRRAPASVRGNPNAAPESMRYRKYINIIILLTGIFMEIDFLTVEIGFITFVHPLLFNIPVIITLLLTVLIFVVYFRFVRVKKPSGAILDDDAKWVLGMFYYNPSDPSVFVEKRVGIGYTVNFARPAAWIFMLGILAFVLITVIYSFYAK
jgi:uncharacterized membrane protein